MVEGMPFRAVVVTDCLYGGNQTFEAALLTARLPYVLGIKPSKGVWAPIDTAHTPEEAAQRLRWGGPRRGGLPTVSLAPMAPTKRYGLA